MKMQRRQRTWSLPEDEPSRGTRRATLVFLSLCSQGLLLPALCGSCRIRGQESLSDMAPTPVPQRQPRKRIIYHHLIEFMRASLVAQWVRNPPANAEDLGSIPGSRRCPGEGNGNPFQYSCLENFMDRGAWWATVHGCHKESDTTEQLKHHHHHRVYEGLIPPA